MIRKEGLMSSAFIEFSLPLDIHTQLRYVVRSKHFRLPFVEEPSVEPSRSSHAIIPSPWSGLVGGVLVILALAAFVLLI